LREVLVQGWVPQPAVELNLLVELFYEELAPVQYFPRSLLAVIGVAPWRVVHLVRWWADLVVYMRTASV
jgi:hypothetical protein